MLVGEVRHHPILPGPHPRPHDVVPWVVIEGVARAILLTRRHDDVVGIQNPLAHEHLGRILS